jgi:hypothetical protein
MVRGENKFTYFFRARTRTKDQYSFRKRWKPWKNPEEKVPKELQGTKRDQTIYEHTSPEFNRREHIKKG